ncbi:hypothetical protein L3V86_09230 [Thiotrichales bacterium 19S11-10]|nr:hypothetical protein [Thiotrichales bacterium 19S11-10]
MAFSLDSEEKLSRIDATKIASLARYIFDNVEEQIKLQNTQQLDLLTEKKTYGTQSEKEKIRTPKSIFNQCLVELVEHTSVLSNITHK